MNEKAEFWGNQIGAWGGSYAVSAKSLDMENIDALDVSGLTEC